MVNFTFQHNKAILAPSMYLSTTQLCSWIGNEPPYFDNTSILKWKFTDIM